MDLVGYLLIILRTIHHHIKLTIKFSFMPMDINQHTKYQVLYKNHRKYEFVTFRLILIDPRNGCKSAKDIGYCRVFKALLIDNFCREY